MPEQRCELTDEIVEFCGCATHRPDLATTAPHRQDLVPVSTTQARYEGKCPNCSKNIHPGKKIYLTAEGEWVCWRCIPS